MQISKKIKNELKSSKKGAWSKEADFRIVNRKWLRYSSHIARRILSAIEDIAGMNQSELARQIGVKPQFVSKIIQGRENLTLETIAKLSEALKVELISFPPYKHTNISQHASAYLWQISSCAQLHNSDLVVRGESFSKQISNGPSDKPVKMNEETVFDQEKINDRIHELQEESFLKQHRRDCKKMALQISTYMKPPPNYYHNQLQQGAPTQPHYDLLKEAESIYQWLIKPDTNG